MVEKSGSWYSYQGRRIAQGRDAARVFLKEHPETMAEVERKVREYYQLKPDGVTL